MARVEEEQRVVPEDDGWGPPVPPPQPKKAQAAEQVDSGKPEKNARLPPPGRGRKPEVFRFHWADLAAATGFSERALRRRRKLKQFNPDCFAEVVALLRSTTGDGRIKATNVKEAPCPPPQKLRPGLY